MGASSMPNEQVDEHGIRWLDRPVGQSGLQATAPCLPDSVERDLSLLQDGGATVANVVDHGNAAVDAEQASAAMLHDSLAALVRLIERMSPGMRGSIL